MKLMNWWASQMFRDAEWIVQVSCHQREPCFGTTYSAYCGLFWSGRCAYAMSPDHAWFRTASPAIKDGVSPVLLKSNKFGLQRNNQSLIAPTFAESLSFDVYCVPTPRTVQMTPLRCCHVIQAS